MTHQDSLSRAADDQRDLSPYSPNDDKALGDLILQKS
jgi:hypothetical protein